MNNFLHIRRNEDIALPSVKHLQISSRVRARLARRQIRADDISIAYLYGARRRVRGAVRYFLRKKDIAHFNDHDLIARLVGLTLVLTLDEKRLITAYKREVNNRYTNGSKAQGLHHALALPNINVRWWQYHFPDHEYFPVKHRPQHHH